MRSSSQACARDSCLPSNGTTGARQPEQSSAIQCSRDRREISLRQLLHNRVDPESPGSGDWGCPVVGFDRTGAVMPDFDSRWGAPFVVRIEPTGGTSGWQGWRLGVSAVCVEPSSRQRHNSGRRRRRPRLPPRHSLTRPFSTDHPRSGPPGRAGQRSAAAVVRGIHRHRRVGTDWYRMADTETLRR